ncbi:MAG: alpha/beta fold hydrolase, partial [Actinobacteria bacterium]|nr:alpha/beta fold hydrolase [Actinomycetota bacterium]
MLTHKLTTDDGVDLIAVEAGNPSGAPIVFVTGLAQTWHTYSRLLTDSALAHYRLIAFNPRGHGASSGGLASMGADGLPVLLPDSLYSTDDPVE